MSSAPELPRISSTPTILYSRLLWTYFVNSPLHGYQQMVVLVVAWAHAMLGLHFWLGSAVVRPGSGSCPRARHTRSRAVAARNDRTGRPARHCARRRAPSWARATFAQIEAAVTRNAAGSRGDHQRPYLVLWRYRRPGTARASCSAGGVAAASGAHRLSRRPLVEVTPGSPACSKPAGSPAFRMRMSAAGAAAARLAGCRRRARQRRPAR